MSRALFRKTALETVYPAVSTEHFCREFRLSCQRSAPQKAEGISLIDAARPVRQEKSLESEKFDIFETLSSIILRQILGDIRTSTTRLILAARCVEVRSLRQTRTMGAISSLRPRIHREVKFSQRSCSVIATVASPGLIALIYTAEISVDSAVCS